MDRVPVQDLIDGAITGPEAVRHLRKVLRLRPGAAFFAYDGLHELRLRLESYENGAAQVTELARRTLSPAADLTVAQCLIKGARWDTFVEKITELGVARILPVLSERTVARTDEPRAEARLVRWHRIARAAAAQSAGRTPIIFDPTPLPAALDRLAAAHHKFIVCFVDDACALADAIAPGPPASTALLLGPEGDFTPDEVAAARAAGFVPVHLGARILRSETAAVAAATLTLHALGALRRGPGQDD